MIGTYMKPGRNRSLYGTVRSLAPPRPNIGSLEDVLFTPPYFYHIPPPPTALNTYPGRKRRKKVIYHFFTLAKDTFMDLK